MLSKVLLLSLQITEVSLVRTSYMIYQIKPGPSLLLSH